jgi:hypothetical protein
VITLSCFQVGGDQSYLKKGDRRPFNLRLQRGAAMSRSHEDIILGWVDADVFQIQLNRFKDAGVDTGQQLPCLCELLHRVEIRLLQYGSSNSRVSENVVYLWRS